MRMRRLVDTCLLVLAVATAAGADAQPCAGFTDVPMFSGFCQDIVWLKNRQITLGCNATEYCPSDPVGRLSMAAFMNRLGDVVTPTVLSAEDSGGTLNPSVDHFLCQTGVVPARNYSRVLVGNAALSFEVTALKYVPMSIVFSTDGGSTWAAIGSSHDFPANPKGDVGSRQHAHLSTWTEYAGHPTIARRYALKVTGDPSAVNAVSGWTCHLQATLFNKGE